MGSSRIRKNDFSGLHKLAKSLEGLGVVRLGLFGEKASRSTGGEVTNPELGAIHELGSATRGIPPRSFLRMPLQARAGEIVRRASRGMDKLLAEGNGKQVLENLGAAAMQAIMAAFKSSGFGTWAPNRPATARRKGSSKPLIDTGALRRAVTWQVKEKGK